MAKHLTPEETASLIADYESDTIQIAEISSKYGISRQGVWKLLKRNGVHIKNRGTISHTCPVCSQEFKRFRKYSNNHKSMFCSMSCYYKYLSEGAFTTGGEYIVSRQGQRIARKKVGQLFDLKPDMAVHHDDRNTNNNDISNLIVFANNADHMRYHRGGDAVPVWRG